jgi:hypothetical protein
MDRDKMAAPVDAVIFSIWPAQPWFIPTEPVAVSFKLSPTLSTVWCGSSFLASNICCCKNEQN